MIKTQIENIFHFISINDTSEPTALYLMKNNEVIEKTKYKKFDRHVFNLRAAGNYSVRWFTRSADGSTVRGQSDPVRFTGFTGVRGSEEDVEKPIVLYGVNPFTLYAAKVLSYKFKVIGLIDPDGRKAGSNVMGHDVIREADAVGSMILRYSQNRMRTTSEGFFSTLPGRSDLVSQTLELFNIMDLYRISHDLYIMGLLEGAKHIQGFIFSKFNCRIPYQAVIGEGTRIGIGGIGVVIHPDSIIGKNCVIAQNVTLGGRAGGNGTPIVGDNVWISPGAKCLGGRIGSNVVIGANAVVLHEIESNSVVAGVPARLITRDMTKYASYIGK